MPAKLAPCGKCPFRTDVPAYIRLERGREIKRALDGGGMFPCHATVDYNHDSGGRVTAESRFCAGALVLMEHEGGCYQNQMVRICHRLGDLDLEHLDLEAPVPHSWRDWFEHLLKDCTA